MTERPKSRWGQILSGVSVSGPPEGNVVHMPRQSLDEHERDVAMAQNDVIDKGAAVDRSVIAYRSALDRLTVARERMADRLKESGYVGEFVTQFPEIDAP